MFKQDFVGYSPVPFRLNKKRGTSYAESINLPKFHVIGSHLDLVPGSAVVVRPSLDLDPVGKLPILGEG